MQHIPLTIVAGATLRLIVRVMQPVFQYRSITAIAGAPVQLTVPGHGVQGEWPVWVRGAAGMPALNRDPGRELPHMARRVDADTLEINTLTASGLRPSGGELIYCPPVDLTASGLAARLYAASGSALQTLSATEVGPGEVEISLTAEQTAALGGGIHIWALDLVQGEDVLRVVTGEAKLWPAGSLPVCAGSGWVVVGGEQGPAGAPGRSVVDVEVDADGYLIVTLDDGTTVISDTPVNRPWGTIIGDISAQTDLMQLLSDLEDSIPTTPADIGAATAGQGDLAESAVQPGDITDVVRDDDPRLTDSRAPTGGAGGVLSGSYPNPGFAVDMATQQELEDGLAGKVDKAPGYGLSQESFTTAEKNKLAGLEGNHFKGVFASLGALQAAFPTASAGDYADVDAGVGSDTVRYLWDVDDVQWVASGSGSPLTAADVKSLYESNPDTNAYTDAEQAKLGAIEAGAQVNAAAVSQAEAEAGTGTALRSWTVQRVWQAIAAWWAASAMKTKLDGIATGATANSADATLLARSNHTGTQAASTISDLTEVTQDVVGAMIVAGSNVSVTYDDVAGALTISASGGGGSVVGACQAAFDGGGSDVAVGSACEIRMPYAMTISKVTVLGDAAGSISVDVRVDSLANYPPLAGDSIVGASPPQLSGSASSEDSTLSGWTTAIAAGSVLRFVVSACSGIGRATVIIEGVRS